MELGLSFLPPGSRSCALLLRVVHLCWLWARRSANISHRQRGQLDTNCCCWESLTHSTPPPVIFKALGCERFFRKDQSCYLNLSPPVSLNLWGHHFLKNIVPCATLNYAANYEWKSVLLGLCGDLTWIFDSFCMMQQHNAIILYAINCLSFLVVSHYF